MLKFNKKNLIAFGVFLSCLLLLSSTIPILRKPLLNILRYPLHLSSLIMREVGGIVFYHRHLIQKEKLSKEVDLLKQKVNAAYEIYQENKRLKELLSFKEKYSYRVIAARVIGRSPDDWSSVIIINKGRHHGIKRGMIAVTYLGLAGRVIQTSQLISQIMLINDPNLGVSAIVQRSRQEGSVSGTLGNYLIMRYLPKDCDIQIQDTVVTSGLTPAYPKGLLIGKVVDIQEEFSGLSRYCLIKPAVNLSNLEEVLIITP